MQTLGKLKLITERAKQDNKLKFTSLAHLINEESLAACYRELKRDKACGIDGVTVEEYGRNLESNLKNLVSRMKTRTYQPKPARRVYIPKPGKEEKRPLGISSVEDKLVQLMLKKILEAIYEPQFLDCSNGFRPKRNCHTAVEQLDKVVMTKPINYIVEVDIKKFFDSVRHYWLLRCVEERVSDPNFLWLIRKSLKAGIVEEGQWKESPTGTPQGSIASPTLANIYLHYVLDIWFKVKFKPKARGYVQLIRYCDDCAPRGCTGDEGRPLEAGLQEQASNHLKLHWLRAIVVSVKEKARQRLCQVSIKEARKGDPLLTCRKRSNDVKTGWESLTQDKSKSNLFTAWMASGMKVART